MLSAQSLRGEARMEIMMIDTKAIEEHIRGILVALGDDPEREGLKDTPKRVAKMYEEVFLGMNYSNHEIAQMFDKTFEDGIEELDTSKVVVMKDIDLFSYCEHHMALMYDMKATVAYIPNGKVIGLSKIARICDMVGRRLQLQERIGQDIADIMTEITGSEDVAVVLEGYHSCVSARGIKKNNTRTMTVELRGSFKDDAKITNVSKIGEMSYESISIIKRWRGFHYGTGIGSEPIWKGQCNCSVSFLWTEAR